MCAFIELSYQRAEDDAGVTLMTALPTVRALTIGGSASELRLPGLPPDAAVATISFVHSHFVLESAKSIAGESAAGAPEIQINDDALPDGGAELQDGDTIEIGNYELRFHEGELPTDPPLLDTPLRWKLPATAFVRPFEVAPDDASAPYIEEFMLAARPHMQEERFSDVRKLTESELRRVALAEEPGTLDRYCRFLWTTRLKMARLDGDDDFAALTREALERYPDDSTLLVTVGVNFLKHRDWATALRTFEHAIDAGTFENFQSRHDARVGRILARHFAAPGEKNAAARPPQIWRNDEWQVPELRLDARGDEVLLWRVCHYGEVFGATDDVRYLYCGESQANTEGFEGQRWEIHDLNRGVAYRRVVLFPSLLLADPSLVVEIAAFRDALEKYDRDWLRLIVDRSHETRTATSLVSIDTSAELALVELIRGKDQYVRMSVRRLARNTGRYQLDIVKGPQLGDVVYTHGALRVAVPKADVALLANSALVYLPGDWSGFFFVLPERRLVRARYRPHRWRVWSAPAASPLIRIGLYIAAAVVLVVSALIYSHARGLFPN